jgi:hypothetical protein
MLKRNANKMTERTEKSYLEEINKLIDQFLIAYPGGGGMLLRTYLIESPKYKTSLDDLRKLQKMLKIDKPFQRFKRDILEAFPQSKVYRTERERGIEGVKILGTD